jgi:putative membrane protein
VKLFIKIVVVAFALFFVQEFIPGITISSLSTALFLGVALALINLLVRPVLFILTLPITILTLGVFLIALNTALFWIAAYIVPGVMISGFVPALLGSFVVSVAYFLVDRVLP